MDQQQENIQDPILLNDWLVSSPMGTWLKLEENDIGSMCITGTIRIEPKLTPCKFCPYKSGKTIRIITSSIHDAKDGGIVITMDGTSYVLGNPDSVYEQVFGAGEEKLVNKLVRIIKKKKTL
jgi:hypothetical protein